MPISAPRILSLTVLAASIYGLGCSSAESTNASDGLLGRSISALSQSLGGEAEPNGTTVQATPIGSDTVVRANIFANGDIDFFKFDANAGDRVYVATMTAFSPAGSDSVIDLIGTDGTTVLETDDQDGSIGTAASSI